MQEILSDIDSIGKDPALYQEKNFILRTEAIDHIEFHFIDRIDALMEKTDQADQLRDLKLYAEKTKHLLEEVNARMFHRLRVEISQGSHRGADLIKLMGEYLDHNLHGFLRQNTNDYDNLDIFLNGLLSNQLLPAETKERDSGMVFYQKTPVRIVLEFIKRADFKSQDIFFDLGSGLGQVTLLVNLFSSVVSKGVEFEPAFCNYANACAAELNLDQVEFINTDARSADYSTGTVFFMYTPFEGKMFQDVLHILRREAQNRKIRIFTYGPCTPELAKLEWLRKKLIKKDYAGMFGEFVSDTEMATTIVDPATAVL
jgi:Histone methylation protein DOT1